ncbi:MAG: diaminopimelate epimerase [Bacteroidetes bacterium]|nr:diaminopimelate epimerase [Bacteroidota bacterium]MCW5896305.1 diaminopimelate epimerase [Bacteroidota bacterium]
MKITIHFTKMSGAGNDFVVIDNMSRQLNTDYTRLAQAVCSRHFGIGADGLLVLEPSRDTDFLMRYYNADGSYGGMCGNGGRCIARYAVLTGKSGRKLRFSALDHEYSAEVLERSVKLWMKAPKILNNNMLKDTLSGIFLDTGSPHFVCEVADLNAVDVISVGRAIRFHGDFAPDGCNVNFVERTGENELSLRTYERGVEGETLACGTGSVASAIFAALFRQMQSPVDIKVRSGEIVRVFFARKEDEFFDVILEGSAHVLFSGEFEYETERNMIVDSDSFLRSMRL